MSSDYELEDTIYLPFTTRAFATGVPTALVSGVVDIYEDVTATPIVTAETLAVSLNSHAGFNMITVTATAASGFEAGKSYTAILDAGTVDSVSAIGEVVAHFTIEKAPVNWAKVTAPTTAVDLSATDIQLVDTATANTDMRGTENAATSTKQDTMETTLGAITAAGPTKAEMDTAHGLLATPTNITAGIITTVTTVTGGATLADILDKVGAVGEAAGTGDPDTAQSLMQYCKQIVNVLEGAAGVTTLKSAAAPASGVSLSEMIRAIYNVMKIDTYAEIAQALPPATPTMEEIQKYLYNALRNRVEVDKTALFKEYFNDTGTLCWKKVISDDGTTYIEQKAITGA